MKVLHFEENFEKVLYSLVLEGKSFYLSFKMLSFYLLNFLVLFLMIFIKKPRLIRHISPGKWEEID